MLSHRPLPVSAEVPVGVVGKVHGGWYIFLLLLLPFHSAAVLHVCDLHFGVQLSRSRRRALLYGVGHLDAKGIPGGMNEVVSSLRKNPVLKRGHAENSRRLTGSSVCKPAGYHDGWLLGQPGSGTAETITT